MTEQLERLTTEVRKLNPAELTELRVWLADYQVEKSGVEEHPLHNTADHRGAWARHFEEIERIWGDKPPLEKNIVLQEREGYQD